MAKARHSDIFKMFLLSCSDEDLNYGMNQKLMTEDDVLKAGMGNEFHLNITKQLNESFVASGASVSSTNCTQL